MPRRLRILIALHLGLPVTLLLAFAFFAYILSVTPGAEGKLYPYLVPMFRIVGLPFLMICLFAVHLFLIPHNSARYTSLLLALLLLILSPLGIGVYFSNVIPTPTLTVPPILELGPLVLLGIFALAIIRLNFDRQVCDYFDDLRKV